MKSGTASALDTDRAPIANLELTKDPAAMVRADKSRAEFEKLYAEVRENKRQHLEKMNASELYKSKAIGMGSNKERLRTAALAPGGRRPNSMLMSKMKMTATDNLTAAETTKDNTIGLTMMSTKAKFNRQSKSVARIPLLNKKQETPA